LFGDAVWRTMEIPRNAVDPGGAAPTSILGEMWLYLGLDLDLVRESPEKRG
jgi:hypothetical protein